MLDLLGSAVSGNHFVEKEVSRNKKYLVRLTDEERAVCEATIKNQKGKSEKLRRATTRPCLADRRITDLLTLQAEIAAWMNRTNAKQRVIRWLFTIENARVKLRSLYPNI